MNTTDIILTAIVHAALLTGLACGLAYCALGIWSWVRGGE